MEEQDEGDDVRSSVSDTFRQVCCLWMEILPQTLRSHFEDHTESWIDSHRHCSHLT